MKESEAICETCCWSQESVDTDDYILCLIEPHIEHRKPYQFCRYWAKTRGLLSVEEE